MIVRAIAVVVALAVWLVAATWADGPLLPGPFEVAVALSEGIADGSLLDDVAASLSRVLVGFCFATVAGLLLGCLTALLGRAGVGVRAVLELLRPIPPIAWVPLAILWFGLGDGAAWAIVFIGAFFPIYIQVALSLIDTPANWLELGRSLGLSKTDELLRIRLPAAAPHIAHGLRTGLGLAWTSVIAAELVGAQSGLGYRIQMHRVLLETDDIVAGMLTIGVLGAAMAVIARLLERRATGWASA